MKTIRIFISSPSDVAEERTKASLVIEQLQRRYAGRLYLQPVLWEDMPLQADVPFQQGINLVLSENHGIDIAVFILWSRLGSPLGPRFRKPDRSIYRSGTEYEFDVAMKAREDSSGKKPTILVYTRNDEPGFTQVLSAGAAGQLEDLLHQRKLVAQFIRDRFHDPVTGTSTGAYHKFSEPVGFAVRLREHLRQTLDKLLPEEVRPATRWIGEPFRGLEVFDVEHADVFFGREQAVCDIQLALQEQAASGCASVLIVGASGSGKSSLARAGVLTAFKNGNLDPTVGKWVHGILQPGEHSRDLLAGLARALADATTPEGQKPDEQYIRDLARTLATDPKTAVQTHLFPALQALVAGNAAGNKVLLLVDQLEELFTHPEITPEAIAAFLSVLRVLASSGPVWVLATVRADFYQHCQAYPDLLAMKAGKGQYDLLPPDTAELQRIIAEPVWLAGLRYEQRTDTDDRLDQRILNDAAKHPEALPLLEYLLRELYERRSPDGLLTFDQYESLGGVEGALGSRAEEVFLALPPGDQAALPEVLHELVTVRDDQDSTVVRQRARQRDVTNTPHKSALVDAFLRQRLFIADKSPDGEAVLHVAHEALLRRWDRAVRWAKDNHEFLRARKRVMEAFARWEAEAQLSDFLLPPGKAVVDAEALLLTHGRWLSDELRSYIVRSVESAEARERKRLNRLRVTAAGFAVLAVLACAVGAVAWKQKNAAVAARTEAERQKQAALTSESKALDQRALAIKAVNDLVFTSQRELLDVPAQVGLREKLLNIARENLPRLSEDATVAGLGTERTLATVLLEVGDIRLGAGRLRQALDNYTQAIAAFSKLAADNAAGPQASRDIRLVRMRLAQAYIESGQVTKAQKLLSGISAGPDGPTSVDDASTLAQLHVDTALASGNAEAALEHFGAWEHQVAGKPTANSLGFLRRNAQVLFAQPRTIPPDGSLDEANADAERAVELARQAVSRDPLPAAQDNLATALRIAAEISATRGTTQRAITQASEAHRHAQEASTRDQGNAIFKRHLAQALCTLGTLTSSTNPPAALEELRAAQQIEVELRETEGMTLDQLRDTISRQLGRLSHNDIRLQPESGAATKAVRAGNP